MFPPHLAMVVKKRRLLISTCCCLSVAVVEKDVEKAILSARRVETRQIFRREVATVINDVLDEREEQQRTDILWESGRTAVRSVLVVAVLLVIWTYWPF